jgi:hypothetical protein
MTSLTKIKGMPTVWSEGIPLAPSLANLSASSFPGIPRCPSVHTTVTLIDPHIFRGAGLLSHTKDDSVVDFASAAICILLLVTYFDSRSSVLLRIAITSA